MSDDIVDTVIRAGRLQRKAERGLTPLQLNLLQLIDSGVARFRSDLMELTNLDRSTVTRTVNLLSQLGMVNHCGYGHGLSDRTCDHLESTKLGAQVVAEALNDE